MSSSINSSHISSYTIKNIITNTRKHKAPKHKYRNEFCVLILHPKPLSSKKSNKQTGNRKYQITMQLTIKLPTSIRELCFKIYQTPNSIVLKKRQRKAKLPRALIIQMLRQSHVLLP